LNDFDAFLRWRCTDRLDPALRHAYAQWLLLQALELDPQAIPPPADAGPTVLSLPVGPVGLSSAACFQSDQQQQPGPISFALQPQPLQAWLLALLQEPDPQRVDPTDRRQWRFWLVRPAQLHPERRSIGLQPLLRAHGDGVSWGSLAVRFAALPPWPLPI
jgi:hypothetical protein